MASSFALRPGLVAKLLHVASVILMFYPSMSEPIEIPAPQAARRLPYPPLPLGWRVSSVPGFSFEHEDGVRRIRSDANVMEHPLFEEQKMSAGFPQQSVAFRRAFNDVNLWHYAMLNVKIAENSVDLVNTWMCC